MSDSLRYGWVGIVRSPSETNDAFGNSCGSLDNPGRISYEEVSGTSVPCLYVFPAIVLQPERGGKDHEKLPADGWIRAVFPAIFQEQWSHSCLPRPHTAPSRFACAAARSQAVFSLSLSRTGKGRRITINWKIGVNTCGLKTADDRIKHSVNCGAHCHGKQRHCKLFFKIIKNEGSGSLSISCFISFARFQSCAYYSALKGEKFFPLHKLQKAASVSSSETGAVPQHWQTSSMMEIFFPERSSSACQAAE